jgi:hypothetical protein
VAPAVRLAITSVDGHQNLPNDGHEAVTVAITESDRIRRSSRRLLAAERRIRAAGSSAAHAGVRALISQFWH